MPNFFQRQAERISNAVGRLLGREPDITRVPTGPLPGAERPGLGERIRNIVRPGRADEERIERERQEIEARERNLAERQREIEERARELAERQREIEQRERLERERIERDRQAARPQPQPAAPQLPEELQGIPPVMPLGPKGRDGAAYTTASADDVMQRLRDAADLGQRVSLRVHDENGWHDLFLNDQAGPGRHKPARGINADYLAGFIGDDLEGWIEDGADIGEDGGYEDELGEPDGYQLTVWS